MSNHSLPLARFKVLDLTRARAGPTAVRQFADWGADVVKIEAPASSGYFDHMSQPRTTYEAQNLHRNKKSMTLNLQAEEGRAVFLRMVEGADVVIENFRPDVKHRLGVDYEACRAVNPRIVYGSISGFGQEGPYRRRPGLDQIAQGLSGLMSVTGNPGESPMRVGIPLADLSAGFMLAQGIMIALLEREVSGEGQWVHTSLLEAQIQMMDFQAARYLRLGEVPGRQGNYHPTFQPAGVFETADGSINIQSGPQHLWERLARALDIAELIDHPDYATLEARSEHRDALHEIISRRTRTKPGAEWHRDHQRGGHTLRPHLHGGPDVRRRAGARAGHGPRGAAPRTGAGYGSWARRSSSRALRRRCAGPHPIRGCTRRRFCGIWTTMRKPLRGGAKRASSENHPPYGAQRMERGMRLSTEKMAFEVNAGIGWMIFNNPERRNALSLEMWGGHGRDTARLRGGRRRARRGDEGGGR